MSQSPRRKAIKRRRLLGNRLYRELQRALADPAMIAQWWQQVTSAQQRLIDRKDPGAFDLLEIAKESLSVELFDRYPLHDATNEAPGSGYA